MYNKLIQLTTKQYSKLWKKESDFFESHAIYEKISKITPLGNALEFGCGIGNGTHHLSNHRSVLALDSNSLLVDEATKHLKSTGSNAKIHKCDFFDLTEHDIRIIADFKPKVIVGWFIGSHNLDIFKHTEEEPNEITKPKLYREKIEDIIVSPDVCLESVEYIHLVNRSALVVGFSEDEIFNGTKKDYDTYVFRNVGFEVSEVKSITWPREGSDFQYSQAENPNLVEGDSVSVIISIVAKRVSLPRRRSKTR